jgi:predicted RNA methylase
MNAAEREAADRAGQWFTRPGLAGLAAGELTRVGMLGPAPFPGAEDLDHARPRILEPCAGDGALVAAVLTRLPGAHVEAVERDRALARQLRRRFGARVHVEAADFLERERPLRPYDGAILNPPQHRTRPGWDGEFIEATIPQARRLVAIVRLNTIAGADRYDRCWSRCGLDWTLTGVLVLVTRPQFRLRGAEPDNGGNGPRHDWAIVSMVRGCFEAPAPVFRWVNGGQSR